MQFKKKWIIIILILAVLAVILWVLPDLFGYGTGQTVNTEQPLQPVTETAEPTAEPTEEATAEPTEGPAREPEKAETTEEPAAQETAETQQQEQPFLVQITDDDPSIAYVLVRMPDPIGLLPLPVEGEYTRTIRQTMPDGTEAVNVLHLTPNGFRMEDSNCEGHDCISEGEVTLENREERVLWNMVICLPHQLALELITREEALQMMGR